MIVKREQSDEDKSRKRWVYGLVAFGNLFAGVTRSDCAVVSDDNIPDAPVYTPEQVPANYCSRYVKLAARDLFDIEYPSDDAWKLRNHEGIDEIRVKDGKLENLVEDEILKPGMVVGMHNPNSKYNSRPEARKAGYTHVVLYLGKKDGKLYFADKFGDKIRVSTLEELKDRNHLMPIEVLFKKKEKSLSFNEAATVNEWATEIEAYRMAA